MKIAIVGGGITGLTAAYRLLQKGHEITVFEKEKFLGGLAQGFKQHSWDWHIESAYHHLFTNDYAILNLLKELELQDSILVKRPLTATLYNDAAYQLDTIASLLSFPGLSIFNRFRTGMFLAFMKYNPVWQPLTKITAEYITKALAGDQSWNAIWKPLLYGKFGPYANRIAASWLWARIVKRTPSLIYIQGGFHTFIDSLEKKITKMGGIILTGTTITKIEKKKNSVFTVYRDSKKENFDRIILTIPTPLAYKIVPELKKNLQINSPEFESLKIPHLHAQVLILETDKPILKNTYWLNITDQAYPFLAIVQHTNLIEKKYYDNHHITYIGNYLPSEHPFLSLSKESLIKKFSPFIKRIQTDSFKIYDSYLFTAPFAQPVQEIHYQQKMHPMETVLSGMYLVNMDSVFPWDRGTNYAVEWGEKIAKKTDF